MLMPRYTHWKIWTALGCVRALLFVIAAQFWFGYIVFLCPEPLFFVDVRIHFVWLLLLMVLDTLVLGYVITLIVTAFRRSHA